MHLQKTVSVALLERMMQIAHDIRKVCTYHVGSGEWFWHDRDEETELHGPFPRFLEALKDAVEPYLHPEE